MLLIDAANAEQYLRDTGRLGPGDAVRRCTADRRRVERSVLRRFSGRSAARLRAQASPRATARGRPLVLRRGPHLAGGRGASHLRACLGPRATSSRPAHCWRRTPRILFEDRENYCFGMEAAPREHTVWKQQSARGAGILACRADRADRNVCRTSRPAMRPAAGHAARRHLGRRRGRRGPGRSPRLRRATARSLLSHGRPAVPRVRDASRPAGRFCLAQSATVWCTPTSAPRTCWSMTAAAG